MQRKAMVALVGGAIVGMGAGALGALLAWEAAGAAACRFLEQLGDQDDQIIELERPGSPVEWHSAQQTSLGSAPVTSPASALSLPHPKEAVTSAYAP